jgi:integrase
MSIHPGESNSFTLIANSRGKPWTEVDVCNIVCSKMASIFKKPGSPFWFAAYRDAHGQRRQKTTKTSNRGKAIDFARALERVAESGRNRTLTESAARSAVSQLLEQSTGEPLQFHTARAWLEEWLAGKKGVTTERTRLKDEQYVGEFLASMGERADAPLAAISPRDVRAFRDALSRAGHSPVTANGALKILASPFNAALRLGYIPVNPCAGVEPLRDEADAEKDVFTPEQVRALIAAAEGDWKGAILAGFFTGLRLRDVTELRWEAVDFKTGMLRVKTRKTGAVVLIPLHAEFSAWLSGQTRGIGKAPIFPDLAGRTGGGKSGLSMKFRGIMESAGVAGRILRQREKKSAGRTQSSLSFHSLRHSFNSALANAGVAQELRQKLTGHASAAMNTKYTHHELDALRAAVAVLPSVANLPAR